MLVLFYCLSVGIHQIESQTAELCTLATVGTTAITSLAHITLPTVANAQGTMNEHFEKRFRTCIVYFLYFIKREFACQNHLTETYIRKELHFLRCTVIHLRTGMQCYRRKVKARDTHILYDQGIYTGTIQFPYHFLRFRKFLVIQDCIYCDIYTCVIQMCMLHQSLDVFYGIASSGTCAETWCTDIDCIGTMIDGLDSAFKILCRSKKFYRTLFYHYLI